MTNARLIDQLFCNPDFEIDEASVGYIARDIINMNWWNTSGVLIGYKNNARVSAPFSENQKRIAVQLKEYYRVRRLKLKNRDKLRDELKRYLTEKKPNKLEQLGLHSMRARANPSQYFHTLDNEMTWVDCTSRATYAAKYVFQNGYVDFDGVARFFGANDIVDLITSGECCDLGIKHLFEDGKNNVKTEIFSQKHNQKSVSEWVRDLSLIVIPERIWLLEIIGHVKTDPFKTYESSLVNSGNASGVNECLYGFKTNQTYASNATHASAASNASRASAASNASRVSRASDANYASSASYASRSSNASDASRASDAGCTNFLGSEWSKCDQAIKKPNQLKYPDTFRKNIFGIAGNWKINKEVVSWARKGWFDPFSGHGTSPLYAKRNGINYLGFDTNKRAFDEYLNDVNEVCAGEGSKVKVQCADSTEFRAELVRLFDLCYTSPPYFNFEEYGGNTEHFANCNTYDDFHQKITVPVFSNVFKYLVSGGVLALQVEKNKTAKQRWIEVISSLEFVLVADTLTGGEVNKYSAQSKRDQFLLIFQRP